ncbi:hypothetical protein B0O99DRAFT_206516 [Bisporella sp. PMI_857]|nr:hypothetical protein B0O99DRAFT_206516 [Bisporella sp. PMI_857]
MAGDGKEKATLRSPRGKKSTAITAWDEIKSDVRRIYIQEDKSLEETMASFQLNACVRTWKAQLKEWDFNQNVPSNVMQYVVSKANKRKREGKDTIFFYGITEINPQKIENFKRRKTGVTPSFPRTPPHLTYYTPNPNCEKAFQNVSATYFS